MSDGRPKNVGIRKSEVVTVRFDPKLKYLAELAARRHRRTLSSYIEWTIEDSLSRVYPAPEPREQFAETFAQADLWDVDEPDRFAKLALKYPDLLDHEEQRLWKLIRENGSMWQGKYEERTGEFEWEISAETLDWAQLREYWETFRSVVRGDKPESALPTWDKHNPVPF